MVFVVCFCVFSLLLILFALFWLGWLGGSEEAGKNKMNARRKRKNEGKKERVKLDRKTRRKKEA